jgi:hypothetical protein
MLKSITAFALLIALTGCAGIPTSGSSGVNLRYAPTEEIITANPPPISLDVKDERSVVTSGQKSSSFLGQCQDVNFHTDDLSPLSAHLKNDLSKELRTLGFEAQGPGNIMRITVVIKEWQVDCSAFHHQDTITLIASDGKVLAQSDLQGTIPMEKSSLLKRPSIADQLSSAYGGFVDGLIRNDKKIIAALRPAGAHTTVNAPVVITSISHAAGPHQYIALFKGNAAVNNAQMSVTYSPCFLCSEVTDTPNIVYDQGGTAGIRWGFWGEIFGFAVELNTMHASNTNAPVSSQVYAGFQSIYLMPMARARFFKSDLTPNGELNLYGGLGLTDVIWGNVDIKTPGVTFSERPKGTGTVILFGASLNYSAYSFFLERRTTDITLSVDTYLGPKASVPINANSTVIGVGFNF